MGRLLNENMKNMGSKGSIIVWNMNFEHFSFLLN